MKKETICKALIKKGDLVIQEQYDKYSRESDYNYYYVYYSNSSNEDGDYLVFTNKENFGEARIVHKTKSKEEAVTMADLINNSIRLLAGYYDNEDNFYKDKYFPLTH